MSKMKPKLTGLEREAACLYASWCGSKPYVPWSNMPVNPRTAWLRLARRVRRKVAKASADARLKERGYWLNAIKKST